MVVLGGRSGGVDFDDRRRKIGDDGRSVVVGIALLLSSEEGKGGSVAVKDFRRRNPKGEGCRSGGAGLRGRGWRMKMNMEDFELSGDF